jgi:hypothetical protein
MRALCEHRGVVFSIPHNDDGVWHYKIYTKRDRRAAVRGQPEATPVAGFANRESAVEAAKNAIDAWITAT